MAVEGTLRRKSSSGEEVAPKMRSMFSVPAWHTLGLGTPRFAWYTTWQPGAARRQGEEIRRG
jgi:hypothetical protein